LFYETLSPLDEQVRALNIKMPEPPKKRVRIGDRCRVLVGTKYWVEGHISNTTDGFVEIRFSIVNNSWYSCSQRIFARWYPFASDMWQRDPHYADRARAASKHMQKLAEQRRLQEREEQECPTSQKTLRTMENSTRRFHELELSLSLANGRPNPTSTSPSLLSDVDRDECAAAQRRCAAPTPPWYRSVVQQWLRHCSSSSIAELVPAQEDRRSISSKANKSKRNAKHKSRATKPKRGDLSELIGFGSVVQNRRVVNADDWGICSDTLSEWSEVRLSDNGDCADEYDQACDAPTARVASSSKPRNKTNKSVERFVAVDESELTKQFSKWEELIETCKFEPDQALGGGSGGRAGGGSGSTTVATDRTANQEQERVRADLAVQLAQFSVASYSAASFSYDSDDVTRYQLTCTTPTSTDALLDIEPSSALFDQSFPSIGTALQEIDESSIAPTSIVDDGSIACFGRLPTHCDPFFDSVPAIEAIEYTIESATPARLEQYTHIAATESHQTLDDFVSQRADTASVFQIDHTHDRPQQTESAETVAVATTAPACASRNMCTSANPTTRRAAKTQAAPTATTAPARSSQHSKTPSADEVGGHLHTARALQVVGEFSPASFDDTPTKREFTLIGVVDSERSHGLVRAMPDEHPAVALGIDPLYRPARECVDVQACFAQQPTGPADLSCLRQLMEAGLIMEEEFLARSAGTAC
jgi:hypothetical protein